MPRRTPFPLPPLFSFSGHFFPFPTVDRRRRLQSQAFVFSLIFPSAFYFLALSTPCPAFFLVFGQHFAFFLQFELTSAGTRFFFAFVLSPPRFSVSSPGRRAPGLRPISLSIFSAMNFFVFPRQKDLRPPYLFFFAFSIFD